MRPLLLLALSFAMAGCSVPKGAGTMDNLPQKAAPKPVEPMDGIEAYPGAMEINRREYDDGGFHVRTLGLSTRDEPEKVKAFYEPKLNAKEMPVAAGVVSIQNDMNGKHYEVTYRRFDKETTITITSKTPGQ